MPVPAHVYLPDPELLQRRLRVFAMIDAIVSPEFRSFEFHPRWGKGETMGAFKNGSGDFFVAWRCGRGSVVRGFGHESLMSPYRHDPPRVWEGLLEEFPAALEYALREPAFGEQELTFCFWSHGDDWLRADYRLPVRDDPDGAAGVLSCLAPNFARWATRYYGEKLPAAPLAGIWRGDHLSDALCAALNPDADLDAVRAEAKALLWPYDAAKAAPPAQPQAKPKRRAPAKPKAHAQAKPNAKATAKARATARSQATATARSQAKVAATPRPNAKPRRR